jgi:hypothetical protein
MKSKLTVGIERILPGPSEGKSKRAMNKSISNSELPLAAPLAEALRVNGWHSPTWDVLSDRERDIFRQGVVHALLAARREHEGR